MKKRSIEEQIIKAIKQHEAGFKVEALFREIATTTTNQHRVRTMDDARYEINLWREHATLFAHIVHLITCYLLSMQSRGLSWKISS